MRTGRLSGPTPALSRGKVRAVRGAARKGSREPRTVSTKEAGRSDRPRPNPQVAAKAYPAPSHVRCTLAFGDGPGGRAPPQHQTRPRPVRPAPDRARDVTDDDVPDGRDDRTAASRRC